MMSSPLQQFDNAEPQKIYSFHFQVDEMFREAPIDKSGNFNYIEFTRILKHGAKDKDEQ